MMQGQKEAWASTSPQGLKYVDAKRGPVNKLDRVSPFRLVPQVHEADDMSDATVTIKLTNKAKDLFDSIRVLA